MHAYAALNTTLLVASHGWAAPAVLHCPNVATVSVVRRPMQRVLSTMAVRRVSVAHATSALLHLQQLQARPLARRRTSVSVLSSLPSALGLGLGLGLGSPARIPP